MLFVTLTMDSLTYGMVCVVDESSGKTMPMPLRVSLPDHLMVVRRRAVVARVERGCIQKPPPPPCHHDPPPPPPPPPQPPTTTQHRTRPQTRSQTSRRTRYNYTDHDQTQQSMYHAPSINTNTFSESTHIIICAFILDRKPNFKLIPSFFIL